MNAVNEQDPRGPDHPEIGRRQGLVTLAGGILVLVGLAMVFAGWSDLGARSRKRVGTDVARFAVSMLQNATDVQVQYDLKGDRLASAFKLEQNLCNTRANEIRLESVAARARIDSAWALLDFLGEQRLIAPGRKAQLTEGQLQLTPTWQGSLDSVDKGCR